MEYSNQKEFQKESAQQRDELKLEKKIYNKHQKKWSKLILINSQTKRASQVLALMWMNFWKRDRQQDY